LAVADQQSHRYGQSPPEPVTYAVLCVQKKGLERRENRGEEGRSRGEEKEEAVGGGVNRSNQVATGDSRGKMQKVN